MAKQWKHWILDQAVMVLNPNFDINPLPSLSRATWAWCLVLHFVFRFLHTSALGAFTNAAVFFSPAKSLCNFSLRAVPPGHAACLELSCRWQCWSEFSVVTGAVSQGHISDWPVFSCPSVDGRLLCCKHAHKKSHRSRKQNVVLTTFCGIFSVGIGSVAVTAGVPWGVRPRTSHGESPSEHMQSEPTASWYPVQRLCSSDFSTFGFS